MMNPNKPPLSPNKPYCGSLNYLKYVNKIYPNAHVRIFKATIKVNGETKDVEIINILLRQYKRWV